MKHFVVLAAVATLIAIGVAVGYAFGKADKAQAPSNGSSSTQQDSDPVPAPPASSGTPITVSGKVECLPKAKPGETTDLSCAIGLQTPDGTRYALTAADPTTTGSLPTGETVTVTGTVTPPSSQTYDIKGNITVTSVVRP